MNAIVMTEMVWMPGHMRNWMCTAFIHEIRTSFCCSWKVLNCTDSWAKVCVVFTPAIDSWMNAFRLLCLFDSTWYARRWKCCSTNTHAMRNGNNTRLNNASRQSITNITTNVMTNVNTSEITLTRPELNVSESVFT